MQIAVYGFAWLFLMAGTRKLIGVASNAPHAPMRIDAAAWVGMGLPLAISGLFSVFLKRGDILALGTVATPAEIAPYAAAVRVAGLTIFGLSAANATSAPLLREFWSAGDRTALQGCVDRSAAIATLFSLPLVLAFLAVPQLFLGAFGPAYLRGVTPLRLLAIGQLVNALTGPVGPVMIAAGRQRRYLTMTALTAVAMTVMLALLVPRFGQVGAAISALTSALMLNSLLALDVRRNLGLRTVASAHALRLTIAEIVHGIQSLAATLRRKGPDDV
jgi:O-antigen/teichoic acid export membrane protein